MAQILVVDDELWVLELICEALQRHGHVCASARTGDEALKLCRGKAFDLLVVDRHMHGMDGLSLIRTLRGDARFKNLKILMCSAAELTGEVSEAFDVGADDYLLKPFGVDILVKKVAQLLK